LGSGSYDMPILCPIMVELGVSVEWGNVDGLIKCVDSGSIPDDNFSLPKCHGTGVAAGGITQPNTTGCGKRSPSVRHATRPAQA
jgi:hypothetical protein